MSRSMAVAVRNTQYRAIGVLVIVVRVVKVLAVVVAKACGWNRVSKQQLNRRAFGTL